MSKHAKKYGERVNRSTRKARPLEGATREPVSPLPREMSAKILSNPKNKLTAKNRKRVLRSRELIVHPAVMIAKSVQDRITAQVGKLSMGQLLRRAVQCPHRIQKAKSILEDLSPDSRFAPDIRRNIALHVSILAVVEAEIKRRAETPAVRDTRTPRLRKAALNQTN